MKTNAYLLVLLLLLLAAGLQAQTSSQKKLGVIGGLNIANFSGDDIGYQNNSGYDIEKRTIATYLGIILNVPSNISKNLALQGEFALSMNRSVWEWKYDNFFGIEQNATWKYNTFMLKIPLSAIYTVNLPELPIQPYLGAGLSASIPISSSISLKIDGEEENSDNNDGHFVLGYQLNLGIEYEQYFCETRYERSITPGFDDNDFYNNLKLLVGFRFDCPF